METGILALVAVAEFFAGLPYAGWRALPPGFALLCLGLGGWWLALPGAGRGEEGAGHGLQNEAGHKAAQGSQNRPLSTICLSRKSHILLKSHISRISHIAKSTGVMLMVAALMMWALTPAPDGALLARGRTSILVLVGPNCQAIQIAPSTTRTRRTGAGRGCCQILQKALRPSC